MNTRMHATRDVYPEVCVTYLQFRLCTGPCAASVSLNSTFLLENDLI